LLVVLAGRQLDVQKNEIEKDYAAAAQHQEILRAKEVWEEKDHRYKMYRYRKARELAKLKIRLCCMEQGALNFVERRNLSKERFDRDFNDAMARYRAVAKGFGCFTVMYNLTLEWHRLQLKKQRLMSCPRTHFWVSWTCTLIGSETPLLG
jgi:hypothetical protein